MVNDKDPAAHVTYSWDRGTTWTKYTFLTDGRKLKVTSLDTEPESTTQRMLLRGVLINSSGKPERGEAIVHLDFSPTMSRVCDPKNDFEWWTLSAGEGSDVCYMGQLMKLQRRKATAVCSVSDHFSDPEFESKHCECTRQDFECNINYELDEKSRECILVGEPPRQPTFCPTGTMWKKPAPYRSIGGTECRGGLKLDTPTEEPCVDSTYTLCYNFLYSLERSASPHHARRWRRGRGRRGRRGRLVHGHFR